MASSFVIDSEARRDPELAPGENINSVLRLALKAIAAPNSPLQCGLLQTKIRTILPGKYSLSLDYCRSMGQAWSFFRLSISPGYVTGNGYYAVTGNAVKDYFGFLCEVMFFRASPKSRRCFFGRKVALWASQQFIPHHEFSNRCRAQ